MVDVVHVRVYLGVLDVCVNGPEEAALEGTTVVYALFVELFGLLWMYVVSDEVLEVGIEEIHGRFHAPGQQAHIAKQADYLFDFLSSDRGINIFISSLDILPDLLRQVYHLLADNLPTVYPVRTPKNQPTST